VQRIVLSRDGRPETDAGGRLARLTTWLDGEMLSNTEPGAALRRDIGETLARLSRALRGFRHPGAVRTHWWDVSRLPALRPLLDELPASGMLPEVAGALGAVTRHAAPGDALAAAGRDGWLRAALTDSLDHFAAAVTPRLAQLPAQVIHADFHGENLLTAGGAITGILDFGDALTGPRAMDVGIAACYQLGPGPDPLTPALDVVAGYHQADPLGDADLELVAEFIVARVVTRIVVSQWNTMREPGNAGYLLRRTPQAITHLAALRRLTPGEMAARLRAACGPPAAGDASAPAGTARTGPEPDGVRQ
jgi:Ser/Thr protein kinase RdoA (MazF antagonist)